MLQNHLLPKTSNFKRIRRDFLVKTFIVNSRAARFTLSMNAPIGSISLGFGPLSVLFVFRRVLYLVYLLAQLFD